MTERWTLHHGDCLAWLRTLPSESVDAVVTDPPYPEIDRVYGRLSEPEWHALMDSVIGETRRVLRPHGSAVFVLQANQSRVGSTRPWLFEFMAKWAREWNMVQDVWWTNTAAIPTVHCSRKNGLMRPSVKACVWLGPRDCFRDQSAVLKSETASNAAARTKETNNTKRRPSGHGMRAQRCASAALERGGVTPTNSISLSNTNSASSSGAAGHGAGTPSALCAWWIRYLSRPNDVICDPFAGAGTTGAVAVSLGRRFVGAEKMGEYVDVARARISAAERGELTIRETAPEPSNDDASAQPTLFAGAK